jgi:hypothetical protein
LDLLSVFFLEEGAKDPSDCLSPAYISDELFSKSQYLERYFPANIPWPMTLAPTNEAIHREITRKKTL